MRNRDTEAMEGSASPRKPKLPMRASSAKLATLLVAWRVTASSNSSAGMPPPSSRTMISDCPPLSSATSTVVAPASRLFSTSSLTTLAGRSTTSPAAIWLRRSAGSTWMRRRGPWDAGLAAGSALGETGGRAVSWSCVCMVHL